jgi:GAF domain-containing protein
MNNPSHHEEKARLADLHKLEILDTDPEKDFDDLVDLAAMICGCPISLLSFVDEDRQWFKARKGFSESETSRDVSICSHAILQEDVFVIENAIAHELFKSNPLVNGSVHVRFYAGAPVYSPSGRKMGTLCVIDRRPKTMLPKYAEALKKLARQASRLLELRVKSELIRQMTVKELSVIE